MRTKILFVSLIVVALFPVLAGPAVPTASAATCRQYAAYTDYYNGKPTLFIYGVPNYGTDSRGIGIYYLDEFGGWIQVPASSDWGVQMTPQVRGGDWTGYYIATRWYIFHWKWNDDWRWYVQMCR